MPCISTPKNNLIKVWPILVMQLRKCRFFSVAHGFQLDNGMPSPGVDCRFLEGLLLVLLIGDFTVDEIVVIVLYIKYTPQSIPKPNNIIFVEDETLV